VTVPLSRDRSAAVPASGTVVVVGASLAGLRACESLRRHGFTGGIVLLGAEQHLPYDRPPLSKQYLAGAWDVDRVHLRRRDQVDELGLDLRLGVRAVTLDLAGRFVGLEDGTGVAYDGLVVATGATPRRWPGQVPSGVRTLRTLEDADGLRAALGVPGARLVVIGGGFLGMEVAATARTAGVAVTVVEPLATPLGRVVGSLVGGAVRTLHERHGVEVVTGTGVARFLGDEQVEGVALEDGTVVPADVVLVAIGVEPETSWLEGSGLTIDRGVVCDATLQAAPGVVVAGDLVRFPHPLAEATVRLEHWTNASEQGAHAARTLLADPDHAEAFAPVPYFWSDQFDVKIQAIGLPGPDQDVVVVEGAPESGRFVACFGREGRLVAALGFGRPRQLMGFRPLLEAGASLDEAVGLLA
jgi:3-phenylpropionate/trans-cinnamate dioxygenase ferredoxin reductase subunit